MRKCKAAIHWRSVCTCLQLYRFLVQFKNGSNADLWRCLHITSKRSKMLLIKAVALTVRVFTVFTPSLLLEDWHQFCFQELNYYRPQTKLRRGNVFIPACQSFCSKGGRCMLGYTHTLGRTPPPPPGRHPLGRLLRADTIPTPDTHCSGRFASYWNAFLYYKSFQKS